MEGLSAACDGRTSAKLFVYSGHDSTLVPFLCALGVYDDRWPPYASNLQIEVAEGQVSEGPRGLWVRVLFNDKEMQLPGAQGVWCR
jgi:hypothetical protein